MQWPKDHTLNIHDYELPQLMTLPDVKALECFKSKPSWHDYFLNITNNQKPKCFNANLTCCKKYNC